MSGPDAPIGVELSVIITAQLPTPRDYVFRPEGSRLSQMRRGLRQGEDALLSPAMAFVVRHPKAGTVLIDTGFHPDVRTDLRKDFGLPMSLLFKGIRPALTPFDEQLRDLDVDPATVEQVLMTHLHVDHTSGMRLLPKARFTCAQSEWAATAMRFAARAGYVRHHLPPVARVEQIDFARDGEAHGPFERTFDVFGDGSIRLLDTPGHTKGHVSILLRLTDGRRVLLVGDAAYTLRSIDELILPLLTDDDGASMRTLRALKAFAEQNPDAILVPSHDPLAWRALDGVAALRAGECAA